MVATFPWPGIASSGAMSNLGPSELPDPLDALEVDVVVVSVRPVVVDSEVEGLEVVPSVVPAASPGPQPITAASETTTSLASATGQT